jgi:superfamily II DNA or RNA helicase
MTTSSDERAATSSQPENLFTTLFAQVFGLEKTLLLAPQYPVEDIYGGSRFVDYALRTADERVAFEIDGLTWHVPDPAAIGEYEDALLRQNSLVHQGWRVFRWTDRQIAHEPEQVKEQLALFLERIPGLLAFDEFLPRQEGAVLELRPHQEDALAALDRLRQEGKTIALLPHAQGAGKTVTAIQDAKRLGGRTLFLAHTRELVTQAFEQFKRLWPEVSTGLFFGGVHEPDARNIAGSIQTVAERLSDFSPDAFDYLVIDEAHHAAAPTYRRVLGYFTPRFILGLTATPDRADGQSVLELFRDCAHRLSQREAVERGELVPIRCVRVETNIDLSKVRYNQVQYNRRDIEDTVLVPARDRLIVDTYQEHIPGRKAVAFCVNVRHGEELAEQFRKSGVPARSVSGRMPASERQSYLQSFRDGKVHILCACDILNEGWDCPDVEALLMARPTLSRVIYLQQLGRGTRKAAGKECLIVFDFVDNATRYNQPLSLHRIVGQNRYRPGGLVLAPPNLLAAEQEALALGKKPTAVLPVGLWVRDYREIDVFNWQEAVAGMTSVADLERRLRVSEGFIKRAITRGELQPDHTLPIGDRVHHYFRQERVDEIRKALQLPDEEAAGVRDRFFEFVTEQDMTTSYKPVFLRALLCRVDPSGRAKLSDLVGEFRAFYEGRQAGGLVVESPRARLARVGSMSDEEVRDVMLRMPFEKFERRAFVRYDRDLAYVRFEPELWRRLEADDVARLQTICESNIAAYYERLAVE